MASVANLRAHLLSSLKCLPDSRTFHLHVLVSSPRKHGQSLFPYASSRPKCLVQDILVLLSEERPAGTEQECSSSTSLTGDPSSVLVPRTFVSAIEASVYAFPASDSTILYISKVDGTGQGAYPSPTSTLLSAFLAFYASPRSPLYPHPATHHLWIHLFARSQRQYLFPNSADHPAKKPLGDVALCKWWKKILGDMAKAVNVSNNARNVSDLPDTALKTPTQSIRLYYVLPGQSELEASCLLQEAQPSPSPQQFQWIYSHPYHIAEMDFPYPSEPHGNVSLEGRRNPPLASLVPHFEDDPKSRFLDELAATSEEQAVAIPVPTPKRKRPKKQGSDFGNSTLTHECPDTVVDYSGSTSTVEEGGIQLETEAVNSLSINLPNPPAIIYNPPSSSPAHAEIHSYSLRPSTPEPAEFPHPVLLTPHTPNLPTLPTSLLSPHTPPPAPSRTAIVTQTPTLLTTPKTPQTPRTPRRPKSDLDGVSPAEFWERMSYRQECAQGAVTGFFVAIFSHWCDNPMGGGIVASHSISNTISPYNVVASATVDILPVLLQEGTVPSSLIKRVMTSLLTGVEFSTTERSHKGTQVMEAAIEGLCVGLGQSANVSQTNVDGVENAKAPVEGSASSDIYMSHVYASLSVRNPPLVRRSAEGNRSIPTSAMAPVNVLSVRRKKKRE